MSAINHDEQCERLPDFWLCHCDKRKRIARGLTELPVLHIQYPICGGCDEETWHDGNSLRCDNCNVEWGTNPSDGQEAERFTDDHDDGHGTLNETRAKWLERHPAIVG